MSCRAWTWSRADWNSFWRRGCCSGATTTQVAFASLRVGVILVGSRQPASDESQKVSGVRIPITERGAREGVEVPRSDSTCK